MISGVGFGPTPPSAYSAHSAYSEGGRPGALDDESGESLLDALDEEQRRAVTSPAETLCVHAGPGSGKTRTLTHRMAYRVATGSCDPRFIVAVTFTRRAAAELGERLTALGLREKPTIGTFHAIASRMIRRWADDERRRPPSVLAYRLPLLKKILRSEENPHAVMEELDWAAANNLDASSYQPAAAAARRNPPIDLGRLSVIMAEFQDAKRYQGTCDFNDLLHMAAVRLETDFSVADAYHWGHRHFFVDEFQDLTPAQFRLLRAQLGNRTDLCAVGDPDQSIFGWNGADHRLLTDFLTKFPEAEVRHLRTNYRSSHGVVAAAQTIRPSRETARIAPQNLHPAEETLRIERCSSASAEQTAVAKSIREEHMPGEPWSAQAVLARTRTGVEQMAKALNDAGIPAVAITRETRFPDNRPTEPDADASDAVCVTTMHAAKGREWSVVHITGLEEGLMPHWLSQQGAALAEEKRLLYVALTRARQKLRLYWADHRADGHSMERRPSRWLSDITRSQKPSRAARNRAARKLFRKSTGSRRVGEPAASARNGAQTTWNLRERLESPLARDLREWRRRQALLARVSPEAVMGDYDLNAVVEHRPSSLSELDLITKLGEARIRNFGGKILEMTKKHTAPERTEPTEQTEQEGAAQDGAPP